jgi:disulfide bond formation protein DsbB
VTGLARARVLAFVVPAALLAGAFGSQYFGGRFPCELCWWQRYGHFTAVACALVALLLGKQPGLSRWFVWLALLGIVASGVIGVYHAGVEAKLFEGFTQCTAKPVVGSTEEMLNDILSRPAIRCDDVQWSFLGISMAGWNAILSLGFASLILWLLIKRPRTRS